MAEFKEESEETSVLTLLTWRVCRFLHRQIARLHRRRLQRNGCSSFLTQPHHPLQKHHRSTFSALSDISLSLWIVSRPGDIPQQRDKQGTIEASFLDLEPLYL